MNKLELMTELISWNPNKWTIEGIKPRQKQSSSGAQKRRIKHKAQKLARRNNRK